jgi:DNA-binding XRE family transcriptional regulator
MNLTFADLLRSHRSRLDLSQAQTASLLGIPLRTFWAWENGVNTPNRMTQRVAVATLENVKTDFLPTKTKRGRPVNREVIVLNAEDTLSGALT